MTAVQTIQKDPRRAIGELPPEIQQAIELRKARNLVAAQIAGMSWGEKIDGDTRRAVAAWGQTYGVDVTTEIHVLGGRVYLNAAYALRRLAEMIAAGLVEYAVADHVEDDPRLKQLGPEGEGEFNRRLRERIKRQIPDEAKSAVVFRVKLRIMDEEICGAKWCGIGKKSDPVGEAFPVETSESRAARRAMRLIASHVPVESRKDFEAIEASAEALSARIIQNRGEVKAQNAALEVKPSPLALPAQGDPYGEPAPIGGSVEEPERTASTSSSDRSDPATQVGRQSATPDSLAEPKRSAAYRFKLPYGKSAGTPIGDVAQGDLDKWYAWAQEQGDPDMKTRGFIAAYEELANERDLERGE